MKFTTAAFAALFALGTLPALAATTAGSATPPSCPGDQPVWVNTKTKAYHLASDPLYGKTKHGTYLCKTAADAAGDHLAKGGKTSGSSAMSGSSTSGGAMAGASPAPDASASPSGKHHRRHHGGAMASPAPATVPSPGSLTPQSVASPKLSTPAPGPSA